MPFCMCISFRVFKASTGQHPKPVKGKMSRNSHASPDFGLRSLSRKESALDSATSAQVSVVDGSCEESVGASSSPNLAEAKYATVATVHSTCLEIADQDEEAILCPMTRSSGKVMTLLVGLLGLETLFTLLAPFRIATSSGSS